MTQRSYRSITADHLLDSLDLVQSVFTAHKDAREGELVRSLVEEILLKPKPPARPGAHRPGRGGPGHRLRHVLPPPAGGPL